MAARHGDAGAVVSPWLVVLEWGRIGCLGFGGPPQHIRMLRELCVARRSWLTAEEFEDAIAACNLLPGPASTQLAIFCAWRVGGYAGGLLGGLAFILPGFAIITVLAALFLSGHAPPWLLAAGAGAGAAVAAVAVRAAMDLLPQSWERTRRHPRWASLRWGLYVVVGATASAGLGSWVVAALICCGLLELLLQCGIHVDRAPTWPPIAVAFLMPVIIGSTTLGLAWVAVKVGALSYGGGFVIVPMMQVDAVETYAWMTQSQFLTAVALGQVTPGPVVLTVAVVGFAAAGMAGAALTTIIAFLPSFVFVLVGGCHFARLRTNQRAQAFLMGAGPAALGAILGAAIPLTRSLAHPWQWAVLLASCVLLFVFRRSSLQTLLLASAAGVAVMLLGARIPGIAASM